MLIMNMVICNSMNSVHYNWDNCVTLLNINYNLIITLYDNCNQSILPCDPDEVSIKTKTGPMRVFQAFTEGYINWEHTGLIMHCIWKAG